MDNNEDEDLWQTASETSNTAGKGEEHEQGKGKHRKQNLIEIVPPKAQKYEKLTESEENIS